MNESQALEVLKQMAAQANAPLQAHIQAQQAYEILKKAIEPKTGEAPKKE